MLIFTNVDPVTHHVSANVHRHQHITAVMSLLCHRQHKSLIKSYLSHDVRQNVRLVFSWMLEHQMQKQFNLTNSVLINAACDGYIDAAYITANTSCMDNTYCTRDAITSVIVGNPNVRIMACQGLL